MRNRLKTSREIIDFFGYRPIISASIKLTRKCNLKCRHCYVAKESLDTVYAELSTEEIFSIIDSLVLLGCMNLFVNGGEPFLRKDIFEIFSYAVNSGLTISCSTNGLDLPEELIKEIATTKPKLFQVSIDGTKDVHNFIRNNRESFDKAIQTLNLARKYFDDKTEIVMATTLMKENKHDIYNLFKIAKECAVDTFCIVPLMQSASLEVTDVSIEDKYFLFNELSDFYIENYKNCYEISFIVPPGLIPDSVRNLKFGEGYLCSFPEMLGFDCNGNVAICDGFLENKEFVLGNLKNNDIQSILINKKVVEIESVTINELEGICSVCKFLVKCQGGCRVAAYNRFKSLKAPDPLCKDFFDKGLFNKENIIKSKKYRDIRVEAN